MHRHTRSSSAIARLAVGVASLLAVAAARADNLHVTAANSSNNSVYSVSFVAPGGTTTLLNTDASSHVSFRSLVYVANQATGTLDLLVADTLGGAIVRYAGGTGAATVVWSTAAGAGPKHPDGLSVDAAGNLYVVSYRCQDEARSELWVLPQNPAVPLGSGFLAPLLIDNRFAGVEAERLKETLVAGSASGAAGMGDLLLLIGDNGDANYTYNDSNDDWVLVYSAASIQALIQNDIAGNAYSGPIAPSRILLSASQFPAGQYAVGMAFWPVDNSLLITTNTRSNSRTAGSAILRYSFTPTSATRMADFADGLGFGLAKVKTALQTGVPYAFVSQQARGQILELGAPPSSGANVPLATVTQNVNSPDGLAVSNAAATAATNCAGGSGCDLLGGVIPHHVVTATQPVTGNVLEQSCVVPVDPRIANGTCTGSLKVSDVCPGFGATVIPDTLCGGSGPSGSGFALIQTSANGVDTVPDLLVYNEATAANILGGTNPLCPQTVLGWAPRSNSTEGTIVEGNNMVELTGYCGSSSGLSRGLSIWGIGLVLNEAALPVTPSPNPMVNFATTKFQDLSATVSSANIVSTVKTKLLACIAKSQYLMNQSKYACAARQVVYCDGTVAANQASYGSSSTNPNPYGEIRGRLANLYLTINSRILHNAPPTAWPLPSNEPPPVCKTRDCDD